MVLWFNLPLQREIIVFIHGVWETSCEMDSRIMRAQFVDYLDEQYDNSVLCTGIYQHARGNSGHRR